MPLQNRRVVLRQVAERAGVAVSTAANVFSNKAGIPISEETRQAVLIAATELGYKPRSRNKGQDVSTYTIGVIISNRRGHLPTNPFYSHVFHGIEQECDAQQISLLSTMIDEVLSPNQPAMRVLNYQHLDGLIVLGYLSTDFLLQLKQEHIPFVLVDHHDDRVQVDSIRSDDEYGGYLATQYLLEKGHCSPPPAILNTELHIPSLAERLRGYRRAIEDAGFPYDERYVVDIEKEPLRTYGGLKYLMNLPIPPTAIFCPRDDYMLGASEALLNLGKRIPNDCSFIGYTDTNIAENVEPPLTSVRVDKELLGVEGVRALLDRLANPTRVPRFIRLGVTIVERASVQAR